MENTFYIQNNLKINEKKKLRSVFSAIGLGLILMMLLFNAFSFFTSFVTNSNNEFYYSFLFAFNSIGSIISMVLGGYLIMTLLKLKHDDVFKYKMSLNKKSIISLIFISFFFFQIANLIITLMFQNFYSIGISFPSFSNENMYSGNVLNNLLYLIFVSVVPAFSEEYLFRGAILGSLRKYGDGFAILISALTFGLMHSNFSQIPFAFIGGLILGYITVYSGSIVPAMIVHFLNNANSVLSEIIYNEFGQQFYIITMGVITILAFILSIYSLVYLSYKDKHIFKVNKAKESTITFKEKVKIFFFTPSVVVFNSIIILSLSSLFLL